jgi:hypothetical protein
MKKPKRKKIIYSINVDDVQEVAEDVLERRLTTDEIETVDRYVGDYIDWFQAIEFAIQNHVGG